MKNAEYFSTNKTYLFSYHYAECDKIKKINYELLNEFENWLRDSKLTDKTINRHIDNVDFYINEFLLYESAVFV